MKRTLVLALVMSGLVLHEAMGAENGEAAGASIADKVSLELEFSGSPLSVDSTGVVDSFTDVGFGEDASSLKLSYDDPLWGATASFLFSQETLRIFYGEMGAISGGGPLSIDELYVWIKPFGGHFKFTGGVFSNIDGISEYIDDIDNWGMGVFQTGEQPGDVFSDPTEITNSSLTNGFLTGATFGPVTLQLLLSPNYSKESASTWASDLFTGLFGRPTVIEANERLFRIGGRLIADVGVGTLSVLAKTIQWPMSISASIHGLTSTSGTKTNFITLGAYFDLTSVENLGLSLGYTGHLTTVDSSDWDDTLWSGIDIRATWTGIEGLSISTHNNISFAKGAENAMSLRGKDASFLTLCNAIGATKELNEKLSVNAEVSNTFSKTDLGGENKIEYDNFAAGAKLIANVGNHAEFTAGLKVDFTKNLFSGSLGDTDDTLTVFSIPVSIKVAF